MQTLGVFETKKLKENEQVNVLINASIKIFVLSFKQTNELFKAKCYHENKSIMYW